MAPPERRGIGMVFQNYAVWPHMTVEQNMSYPLRVARKPREQVNAKMAYLTDLLELKGLEERYPSELSGGQQQRVALGRALSTDPKVMLLDEPLSNLDAKLRDETRTQIRQIQQKAGTTSVYVTHDQAEAMAMSDRIAVMNGGILHQLGTPREVYRRPATAFVARFIGRSNVLDGVVEGRDGGTAAVRLGDGSVLHAPVPAEGPLGEVGPGAEVGLSVRPEAMRLLGVAPSTSDRAEGTLHARVTLIEFTGSQCMIGLSLDGHDAPMLVTIPDTDDLPAVGDVVALRPDPARIWLVAP